MMLPVMFTAPFWMILLREKGPLPVRLTVIAVSPVIVMSPPIASCSKVPRLLPSAVIERPPVTRMVPA